MSQALGKFRRFYLVHFKKAYVHNQLLLRTGECSQCGKCCLLLFNCPMLTPSGLCLIYNKIRPNVCRVFPIDQRDINEVAHCREKCGYQFKGHLTKDTDESLNA